MVFFCPWDFTFHSHPFPFIWWAFGGNPRLLQRMVRLPSWNFPEFWKLTLLFKCILLWTALISFFVDFSHQRIFFLDCIAVSNDPDPLKCVHSPLEFYLTSFSIKDGLSDMGYHSFVLAGNELSVPSEHKHGTTLDKTSRSFREFARASAKASKAAWHQGISFFSGVKRVMISYVVYHGGQVCHASTPEASDCAGLVLSINFVVPFLSEREMPLLL